MLLLNKSRKEVHEKWPLEWLLKNPKCKPCGSDFQHSVANNFSGKKNGALFTETWDIHKGHPHELSLTRRHLAALFETTGIRAFVLHAYIQTLPLGRPVTFGDSKDASVKVYRIIHGNLY